MNYTVVWLLALHDDLARLYLQAWDDGTAPAVTRAVDEIDRRLSADPGGQGESRPGGGRLLIELPVSVDYEVHEDQRTVVVTAVRYHPPRPR